MGYGALFIVLNAVTGVTVALLLNAIKSRMAIKTYQTIEMSEKTQIGADEATVSKIDKLVESRISKLLLLILRKRSLLRNVYPKL